MRAHEDRDLVQRRLVELEFARDRCDDDSAVTSRIRLSTAVCLPVESDPITLAKTIATLDHLSNGRVTTGAGFGWNTEELEDHHVPADKRRTVLREYVEAMRALWTQDEAG